LVDDEPHVIESLARALRDEPYEILGATSASEALRILANRPVDVVVSDEKMPGMSGSDFLARVCRDYPDTIRIMLTGHASVEAAMRAINEGEIYRFFLKPCNQVDLILAIRQALHQKEEIEEGPSHRGGGKGQSGLLKELEKQHPGITKVKKDPSGATIIEDPGEDFETLMKEIEGQTEENKDAPPNSG
jgi:DNA-binding NtrC family response regulator